MKAIVQSALGEPATVLKLIDIQDTPQPGPEEVLMDVKLASVHHGDLGMTRFQPSIPEDVGYVRRGSEAVGIVRALGFEVEGQGNLKVGDRVIGFPALGSWAESVAIPALTAIPVPPEVGDEVAAQLLINYVTARMILRGLRKTVSDEVLGGGAILVTGASTVVARLLLHFLNKEGLKSIGLARSAVSAKRVADEQRGVQVAATEDADWQAQVTSIAAGRKIVGVLDCVSGAVVEDIVPLLADDAAIITYGALGGGQLGVNLPNIINRQFVIRGVTFGRWFYEVPREEQINDIQSAFKLADELPSLFKVGGIYSLADFQQAIAAVEAPNRDGFVFLKP
ncbi:NADPH:quinone reductase-like Zn-dependent oxidoreductase [Sphingobium xenophagum]|uniref:NADPH:quinone reductase-like Zn-dependent oxidoreductase n=1 Tax=Sphingobium xenophagum TaxID=121428 RepID=A0ABU1X550_SPHXE|nr:alcohol dehydrogenase catalytic domain-containing protein [Sphingobium xenophagum]MDR7156688.1 NADPH:quinone reductase-like Zn-dependent oxidoreductase [Sphingobium xenophagum]